MVQLPEPVAGTAVVGMVRRSLAEELAMRICFRTRMAGIAVVACCIADTAVVAVLAFFWRQMLVDHRGYDHIVRQPVIACLASLPAFLLVSENDAIDKTRLTLLGMFLLCIPVQFPTHSIRLLIQYMGMREPPQIPLPIRCHLINGIRKCQDRLGFAWRQVERG